MALTLPRRSFLALFGLVLLLVLAAIEGLLRFGPTAFLTLLAVLWARVDHQSKLIAPWLRLSRRPSHPTRTLQLDYLSDFLPWSVFKAARNKNFIVCITSAVSVLLKVLIIISTGLITLSWTPVSYDSYPMVAQSVFKNSNAGLANSGTLAYYMMSGHAQRNLTYPDGLFGGYAFQTIQSGSQTPERTNVTVDAFRGSLDYPDCKIRLLQLNGPTYRCDNCTTTFARYAPVWCDGTGSDGELGRERRIFVLFGGMNYVTDTSRNLSTHLPVPRHPFNATLQRSSQLLCIPKFNIGKVEVVRDRADIINLTPVPSSFIRTLDAVDPWGVATAHFNVTNSVLNNLKGQEQFRIGVNISETLVDVDSYMELAIETQVPSGASAASLFDVNALHQLAEGYYQQSTAIIARQALLEPASVEVRGTATVFADRLLVRAWAAHWMAGILAFCTMIILVALVLHDGMASLIQQSDDLVARLRFSGTASDKQLGNALESTHFYSENMVDSTGQERFSLRDAGGGEFAGAKPFPQIRSLQAHPAIVHPATRTTLCVILAGLVVAVEVMLRKSIKDDGLGDEGEGAFIHYTWTTIPAVVLGAVAMVVSAMEFRIRCLAPYVTLNRQVGTQAFMSLDLLDMSLPRLLYREIRVSNIGALTATLAVSFAHNPASFYSDLRAAEVSSLILTSNYTYGKLAYEDLAFPQLVFSDPSVAQSDLMLNDSSVSIDVVVPAVRGKMHCRLYDRSMIRTNLTLETSSLGAVVNPLRLDIGGEGCVRPQEYDVEFGTNPETTYFGLAKEGFDDHGIKGCSDLVHIWGKMDYAAEPVVRHVAALGCNMTMEAVDVDVTFSGTVLDIDKQKPPRPREDTARVSRIWERNETCQDERAGQMTPFFQLLTTSPWAVPEFDLGDAAADEKVMEAIKFQNGIIIAQSLALNQQPANVSNATFAEPRPGDNDAQLVFDATVTLRDARRRVVQDALSTRVLEGLLGATLLLLIASWIFMRKTAVLASSPTSIASRAALIAGGNLLSLLPENAQARGPEEIAAVLGTGTHFQMGWGAVKRFGIFAARAGKEDAKLEAQFGHQTI
ncbi:hypothetical protein QBC34DRAFT_459031 [Podospora aff. communis PSN243]|uniref:Uncharacterized protein n=1 Tax=Podospora aff. communis PSN243 TaxID=3040156 RepID=A0AAV9GSN8_9PEZI|nr:hypothetical protein QBC34DRAFT_459031 [Podospora aff. communis PSN243]